MRSELVVAALDLAWRQWIVLGVSGTSSGTDRALDHAIDLEALICITGTLGVVDPRLEDEALDWCVAHSQRLVSTSRLRQLRRRLDDTARHAYDRFAAHVNATTALKTPWPTDSKLPAVRTSGKSRPPDIAHRDLVQLRLRCLFGVTARADLLLQFLRPNLTQETYSSTSLSVAALSELGFTKPAVGEVLSDLVMAGLIERWRRSNRDYFTLSRVAALQGLLGGVLPATAPTWAWRFPIVANLIATASDNVGKKPIVQMVALTKTLARATSALEFLGFKPPLPSSSQTQIDHWAVTLLHSA